MPVVVTSTEALRPTPVGGAQDGRDLARPADLVVERHTADQERPASATAASAATPRRSVQRGHASGPRRGAGAISSAACASPLADGEAEHHALERIGVGLTVAHGLDPVERLDVQRPRRGAGAAPEADERVSALADDDPRRNAPRFHFARNRDRFGPLRAIASDAGVTPAQLALHGRWRATSAPCRSREAAPPSTSTGTWRRAEVRLDPATPARADEASAAVEAAGGALL